MKSVGTVHSLDRVNRLVYLERLGQRRYARSSILLCAQSESAAESHSGVQRAFVRQVHGEMRGHARVLIVALVCLRNHKPAQRKLGLASWSHGSYVDSLSE
jgi:hypothetical protein